MNFLGQKWGAGNNGVFWVQFLGAGSPPYLFTQQEVEAYLPTYLVGSLQNIVTIILCSGISSLYLCVFICWTIFTSPILSLTDIRLHVMLSWHSHPPLWFYMPHGPWKSDIYLGVRVTNIPCHTKAEMAEMIIYPICLIFRTELISQACNHAREALGSVVVIIGWHIFHASHL